MLKFWDGLRKIEIYFYMIPLWSYERNQNKKDILKQKNEMKDFSAQLKVHSL